eukprot:Rmarinus@m.16733
MTAREKLDFRSESFDALEALRDGGATIPVPDAPLLDRVHFCQSVCTDPYFPLGEVKRKQQDAANERKKQKKLAQEYLLKKKQQAQECLTQTPEAPVRSIVLERILEAAGKEGPMSLLHQCWKDATRVKVCVRWRHEVRGYVWGFIKAYDKHCNLVLQDAVEEYWPAPALYPPPCLLAEDPDEQPLSQPLTQAFDSKALSSRESHNVQRDASATHADAASYNLREDSHSPQSKIEDPRESTVHPRGPHCTDRRRESQSQIDSSRVCPRLPHCTDPRDESGSSSRAHPKLPHCMDPRRESHSQTGSTSRREPSPAPSQRPRDCGGQSSSTAERKDRAHRIEGDERDRSRTQKSGREDYEGCTSSSPSLRPGREGYKGCTSSSPSLGGTHSGRTPRQEDPVGQSRGTRGGRGQPLKRALPQVFLRGEKVIWVSRCCY